MHSPKFSDHMRLVLETVRKAGAIIREHWDQPRQVKRKGRIDLVTQTDLAVEKYLKEALPSVLPEAGFLAEESAEGLEPSGLCWVIDPLDGTTNYAHSLPFVAVSVGLWRHGRVDMGVVYNPILDECFAAERGRGTWLNGRRVEVSEANTLEDCVAATGFPYTVREKLPLVLGPMGAVLAHTQGLRRYGAAAVDLAYLSSGKLDFFYEPDLKPWDTAAGWLLVEEAGGRVTQYDPAQPYHLTAPTILASNGRIHAEAARIIAKGLET